MAKEVYDIVIIGSGPGGFEAAKRAKALRKKVAVIEKGDIGGICVNWGCIPTKALLQSAHLYDLAKRGSEFGLQASLSPLKPIIPSIYQKSRAISANLSKSVEVALNKGTLYQGTAKLLGGRKVEVTPHEGEAFEIEGKQIIIATGARPRRLDSIPFDGRHIISYREALNLDRETLPREMAIVGSGAIGMEFAQFFSGLGVQITLIEAADRILPLEDEDTSKLVARHFGKYSYFDQQAESDRQEQRVEILTSAMVESSHVDEVSGNVTLTIAMRGGKKSSPTEERIERTFELVLVAAGVVPNVEEIGLAEAGVELDARGRIKVNDAYQTTQPHIYAIGDVISTPALAHVASMEGVKCVEGIAGLDPKPINYSAIPACTYIWPEVASVGMRGAEAKSRKNPDGLEMVKGTFLIRALGKAMAIREEVGQVKLLFRAEDMRLVGAHLYAASATEMIGELALAIDMGATAHDIANTVHPHPTLCESVMEAARAAIEASEK